MPRYPYRDLGTSLGRDFRNKLNANFDDIEADVKDLDTRIDNIVAQAGSDNTEIVDARYDSVNNVTHPTLKDRLDDTSDKIGILQKSNTQWINILEYNGKVALSDGWDITPIIDQVINDCISQKKPLYVPQGTIYTSKPIRPNQALDPLNPIDGFTIFGVFAPIPYNDSKMPSLIKPTASFPTGESILDFRYTKRSAIFYIGIEGKTDVDCIEFGERDKGWTGRVYSSHTVENCSIHGGRTGIKAQHAGLLKFRGNNISGFTDYGINLVEYCGDSDLEGNYINTVNYDYQGTDLFIGSGIYIGPVCHNVNIRGGKIEWNAKGITVQGSTGINIIGVQFDVNKWSHIFATPLDNGHLSVSLNVVACRFLSGGTYKGLFGKSHIDLREYGNGKIRANITGNIFKKAGYGAYDLDSNEPVGPDLYCIYVESTSTGDVIVNTAGNDFTDGSEINVYGIWGPAKIVENGNAINLPSYIGNGGMIERHISSTSGGNFKELYGLNAPTTGTWKQGDYVKNMAPIEQGTAGSKYVIRGWVCISGGAPGTWVQDRALTGN